MALDLQIDSEMIPSGAIDTCEIDPSDLRRLSLNERRPAGAGVHRMPSDTTLVLKSLGIELSVPGALVGRYSVLSRALAAPRARLDAASQATIENSGASDQADPLDVARAPDESEMSRELPEHLRSDSVIEHLINALSIVQADGSESSLVYADAVRLALVTRMLGGSSERRNAAASCRMKIPLPKWRLKRAIEYIETHHARTITLNDLAAAAGLSRMHFAAQFRAATGLRPREFVLQRRITRSQHLLANTQNSVVDIAMTVGFQTQAHFTTVFKRFVGDTPYRWRCKFLGNDPS